MASEQTGVVGWLTAAQGSWPGVLLHRDAFLVRAPRDILTAPPDDLRVVIPPGRGVEPEVGVVAEALLLEVDGPAGDPATAMLRLAADIGFDVSTVVSPGGFDVAVRVTGDVWKALESLGLIPDRLADQPPARPPLEGSLPVSVKTVQVEPAGWCDIFWWLC